MLKSTQTMTVTEQVLLNATLQGDHDTIHEILMFLRPDTAQEMKPDVVDTLFDSISEQLKNAHPAELKAIKQNLTLMVNTLKKRPLS